jgi:acetyltransferase-like isoleucine patch superfamily enzyme
MADAENIGSLRAALERLQRELQREMRARFDRRVSLGDLITDRWRNAEDYNFGSGTSCYDNVLVIGDVKVGSNCWIGPGVVLDGSAGLEIGDYCTISAGVQIYTHNTVRRTVSLGQDPVERRSTKIGSGVYIGPNTIVEMGSKIGDRAIVGAMSLVNRDIPDGKKAWGVPVSIIGPSL